MDEQHYHYDCPLCSEEAIPERCPAFRIEWELPYKEYVMDDMVRVWFKDGNYMDMVRSDLHFWEMDSEVDYTEPIDDESDDEEYVNENGHWRQV